MPGVAVAGASLIAVSPMAPPLDVHIVSEAAVRLADASDPIDALANLGGLTDLGGFTDLGGLANVPVNLFDDIANIPYNEIMGLNELTADLDYTNNWFLYDPTNVLGIDEADPGKGEALMDMLVPFPALSHYAYPIGADPSTIDAIPDAQSLGFQVDTIAEAELPMNAGCTGLPGPCDPSAILSHMFTVPLQQLYSAQGYTFPTVIDPVNGATMPWSGEHVSLDAAAPFDNFFQSLTADPSTNPIETLNPEMVSTALTNFGQGLNLDFNPFVQGSYLFDPSTSGFAFIALPLSPILCPDAACAADPIGGTDPVPPQTPFLGLPSWLTTTSPGIYGALWNMRNVVAELMGKPVEPLPSDLAPAAAGVDTFGAGATTTTDSLFGGSLGDPSQLATMATTPFTDLSQFATILSGADLGSFLNPAGLDPALLTDFGQFFDASPILDMAQALSALIP